MVHYRTRGNGRARMLGAAGLLLSASAWGWNASGHMAVGTLADALLAGEPAARQIGRILGPDENLAQAAIWPDCVKAVDPTKDFAYRHTRYYDHHCRVFDRNAAGIEAMQAYVRRNNDNCSYGGHRQNCHKSYHFADIPPQRGSYDATSVGASAHDIVHTLDAAIGRLRGEESASVHFADGRQGDIEALRLVAHLVGDLHQPLHVGSPYLDQAGRPVDPTAQQAAQTDTQGGNLLAIGSGNLHEQWDRIDERFDALQLLETSRAVATTDDAVERWPQAWATESVLAATTALAPVKPGAKEGPVWPVTLDDRHAYNQARHAMQKERIALAGARLAQLLRAIWPD